MNWQHVAHWVGLAGEVFNFSGASVLALDLLLRRRELSHIADLEGFRSYAIKWGLTNAVYEDQKLCEADFVSAVLANRAGKLGLLGVTLLAVGFALVGAYHLVEIYI